MILRLRVLYVQYIHWACAIDLDSCIIFFSNILSSVPCFALFRSFIVCSSASLSLFLLFFSKNHHHYCWNGHGQMEHYVPIQKRRNILCWNFAFQFSKKRKKLSEQIDVHSMIWAHTRMYFIDMCFFVRNDTISLNCKLNLNIKFYLAWVEKGSLYFSIFHFIALKFVHFNKNQNRFFCITCKNPKLACETKPFFEQ